MNKYLSFFLSLVFFISCKNDIPNYDEIQKKSLEDKFTWVERNKLSWKDFIYDETKDYIIYAKLGIGSRYNIDQPVRFDSFTSFSLSESFVSDTTDIKSLRIAQAKFDLLETYRLNLDNEIDRYRQSGLESLSKKDFNFKIKNAYKEFDAEWESLRPILYEKLDSIEIEIYQRLK